MDFYFELRNFLNIYDLVDEHYVMYSELEADGRFMLKLFVWTRRLIYKEAG